MVGGPRGTGRPEGGKLRAALMRPRPRTALASPGPGSHLRPAAGRARPKCAGHLGGHVLRAPRLGGCREGGGHVLGWGASPGHAACQPRAGLAPTGAVVGARRQELCASQEGSPAFVARPLPSEQRAPDASHLDPRPPVQLRAADAWPSGPGAWHSAPTSRRPGGRRPAGSDLREGTWANRSPAHRPAAPPTPRRGPAHSHAPSCRLLCPPLPSAHPPTSAGREPTAPLRRPAPPASPPLPRGRSENPERGSGAPPAPRPH